MSRFDSMLGLTEAETIWGRLGSIDVNLQTVVNDLKILSKSPTYKGDGVLRLALRSALLAQRKFKALARDLHGKAPALREADMGRFDALVGLTEALPMGAKPKPGHPPEEWLVHGRDLVANAQTDMAEAARAFKGNSANVKAARDIQRQLSKLEDRIQALVDSALGN